MALTTASKELKSFYDKELHKHIDNDSQSHIQRMNIRISKVDQKLKYVIDKDIKCLFGLITSVKGVGLQIAANSLMATHGFPQFTNWRKFSCYCGLAPFEYS
ncbi:MAG: IS110 family transposase [Cytophagia bacterium]|nr:IS110 family transposase [Cytophagia bacterium]